MVRAGAQPAQAGCVTDLAIGSSDWLGRWDVLRWARIEFGRLTFGYT